MTQSPLSRFDVRLSLGLILVGLFLAGTAWGASNAWYENSGRRFVRDGDMLLAPPRARVSVQSEEGVLRLSARIIDLSEQEDINAPAAGPLSMMTLTLRPVSHAGEAPAQGCGDGFLATCTRGFIADGRWATVSWPAAMQARPDEMEAFAARLLARWETRATALLAPGGR